MSKPMKEVKDKSLEFVLHHYQSGKFDTQKALRKVSPAKVFPLWRKMAVAASFTLLLLAGAYAAYTTGILSQPDEPVKNEQPAATTTVAQSKHFHFDNTPLPIVLKELGEYYQVSLTVDDTNKHLTADFDSDNLEQTIEMIEHVLEVKITVSKK